MPNMKALAALLAGSALAALPAPLMAQVTPREAQLEARLAQLEAAVAELKGELAASRAAPTGAAAAPGPAVETEARLAALEARPVAPKDGFRIGSTTFKIGGFVRVNAAATRYNDGELAVGSLGKEFYLPQQIPVGGRFSSQDFLIQARQTRFALSTETPAGQHALKSHIEFDFAISTAPAGAQRATNAFVPTLRRAFATYHNTLIGQEWTTFQNVGVLPETTDFVGPLEGTVFVRQAMVRQSIPLGAGAQLQLALENPETETVNTVAPGLIDNDDDRLPDLVARVNVKTGPADLSLAGIARELRIDQSGGGDSALGWGVSGAGKIAFGPDGRHDLRLMASYGEGLGRYLGLGFVADAVFGGRPDDRLETIRNFAGFAAVKIGWTPTLRSTAMGGYQTAWYPDTASPLNNKGAWSVAGNLFWTPARSFDVGIEYRHAVRELIDGQTGSMDRLEIAAKYSY